MYRTHLAHHQLQLDFWCHMRPRALPGVSLEFGHVPWTRADESLCPKSLGPRSGGRRDSELISLLGHMASSSEHLSTLQQEGDQGSKWALHSQIYS